MMDRGEEEYFKPSFDTEHHRADDEFKALLVEDTQLLYNTLDDLFTSIDKSPLKPLFENKLSLIITSLGTKPDDADAIQKIINTDTDAAPSRSSGISPDDIKNLLAQNLRPMQILPAITLLSIHFAKTSAKENIALCSAAEATLDTKLDSLLEKTYISSKEAKKASTKPPTPLFSINFFRANKKTAATDDEVAVVLYRPQFTFTSTTENTTRPTPEMSEVLTNFVGSEFNWTTLTGVITNMVRDNRYLTKATEKNMDYDLYSRNYFELNKKGSTLTTDDEEFVRVLDEDIAVTNFTGKDAKVNAVKAAAKKWNVAVNPKEQDKHIIQILSYYRQLYKNDNGKYERVKTYVNLLKDNTDNITLLEEIHKYFNNTLDRKLLGGEQSDVNTIPESTTSIDLPSPSKYARKQKTLSKNPSNNSTRRKK